MVQQAVAAGVALLDRSRPGWAAQINIGHLIMRSCNDCVLGQLYQSYSKGLLALGLRETEAPAFGFVDCHGLTYAAALDAEWR
jgi:hypothetical protein